MSKLNVDVNLVSNNIDAVKQASKEAIEAALEAIGLDAVGYAVLLCPARTGRLRNSLVYATHGSGGGKGGNEQGGEPATEEDMTPNGTPGENMVAIGTNVEYASYVELGTSRQTAQPYLAPAIEGHIDEYRQVLETMLKTS